MSLKKIYKLKQEGLKIGFTASSFDLLHPGHLSMLAECKLNCDYLIVGLLTDATISRPLEKLKPLQTSFERWIQISSLEYIDMIIPFDTEQDLENMLHIILPHIRFVGEEYRNKEHTGKNIKEIEIFYNRRSHSYSSSELKNRIEKLKIH